MDSISIPELLCIAWALPVVMLALIWVLGCLRAIWHFFHWLRCQFPSTRRAVLLLPITPVLVMLLGTYLERQPGNITTCGVTFTVLAAISIAAIIALSGALHAYVVLEDTGSLFRRTPWWRKALVLGIGLDLLAFWLLQR